MIGYQDGAPDAFRTLSIDGVYVGGVSLTHGQSPLNTSGHLLMHLMRLGLVAPAQDLTSPTLELYLYSSVKTTSVIQEADTHMVLSSTLMIQSGMRGYQYTCCEFNNPPWFCKQLPQPTTDDIELRLCGNEDTNDEDTLLKLLKYLCSEDIEIHADSFLRLVYAFSYAVS